MTEARNTLVVTDNASEPLSTQATMIDHLRDFFLWTHSLWKSASVSMKCGLVSNAVFWNVSLLCLYADRLVETKRSPLLERCKTQPRRHLSRHERRDLIALSAFNMIFVALFLCCPLFEWAWNVARAEDRLTESDAWSWREETCRKLVVHAVVTEVWFYAFHRLLHSSSWLYRRVHAVHHRFTAPTAMASAYAHPLEFALGNVAPIWAGPILTNAHPFTCYAIWFPLAMLSVCKGHCGYEILGHVDHHDDHHLFFDRNYGGLPLLDRLFGTNNGAAIATVRSTRKQKERRST